MDKTWHHMWESNPGSLHLGLMLYHQATKHLVCGGAKNLSRLYFVPNEMDLQHVSVLNDQGHQDNQHSYPRGQRGCQNLK